MGVLTVVLCSPLSQAARPAPSAASPEERPWPRRVDFIQAGRLASQGGRAAKDVLQLSEQQPVLQGFPEPREQMVGPEAGMQG